MNTKQDMNELAKLYAKKIISSALDYIESQIIVQSKLGRFCTKFDKVDDKILQIGDHMLHDKHDYQIIYTITKELEKYGYKVTLKPYALIIHWETILDDTPQTT